MSLSSDSERLEFPLAQGWSRGLEFVFEDQKSSAHVDVSKSLFCKQVHGREIYQLSPGDLARQGTALAEADGMWAQGDWVKELNPQVLIRTADCAPILMVDHLSKSVAAIHAGWRGVLKGIHRVPFEDLSAFTPKSTWVWIGPCINGSSFEVGPDMYDLFPKAVRDNPKYFSTTRTVVSPASSNAASAPNLSPPSAPNSGPPSAPNRRYFNVWDYLADEFTSMGVDLIYNVETDTFTQPAFASYRRAQGSGQKLSQQNFSWLRFAPTKV